MTVAFESILDELAAMHAKKQADYGRPGDGYANVRSSQDWGIAPWVGALVRAGDKFKRLQLAAQGGTLTNEGAEDSLLDLAVYAIIALALWREDAGERWKAEWSDSQQNWPPPGDPNRFEKVYDLAGREWEFDESGEWKPTGWFQSGGEGPRAWSPVLDSVPTAVIPRIYEK